MDIDDILASVDRPRGDVSASSSSSSSLEARDLRELARAWVNEKNAPEILPWPDELMERILDRVRKQIELVEEQTGDPDPKTNFKVIIVQTELERFKFLVRSYLRTRLAKIDKHALHYLNNATQREKLSQSELQYATAHQTLLESHYRDSFLAQLPASLQRLDDTAGGMSMIDTPDADRAVFVRALVDNDEPIVVEGTDIAFRMQRGGVFVVRWSAIRERVEKGEAELI